MTAAYYLNGIRMDHSVDLLEYCRNEYLVACTNLQQDDTALLNHAIVPDMKEESASVECGLILSVVWTSF